MPLAKKEVDRLMNLLTKAQQDFLYEHFKQSKKSKWLEILAQSKGIVITEKMTYEQIEDLIDDWILVDVLDSGFGNRDYKCECGASLRYQYVVYHKQEQKTHGFGETCYKNHTDLSAEIVKDIIIELHKIDLERDEILIKVGKREYFDYRPYQNIPDIPSVIKEQAQLRIPLTDKQINELNRLKTSYENEQARLQAIRRLSPKQKELWVTLPPAEQNELIQKFADKHSLRSLPDGFHHAEMERFIASGLPFLNKHLKILQEYNQQQKTLRNREQDREKQEYFEKIKAGQTRNPQRINTTEKSIDFETLMDRHQETLKQVSEKEAGMPEGLRKDWERIRQMARQCKKGEEFDYSSFKVNLQIICYPLRIQGDRYL